MHAGSTITDKVILDIARYEAMANLCDHVNPDNPDEAEQDRATHGAKYVREWTLEGRGVLSSAYVIRFLVEVCGHSYGDALTGLIEDRRSWPIGEWPDITPEQHARDLRDEGGDIIEVLFNLKIARLACQTAEAAAFYRDAAQEPIRLSWKSPATKNYDNFTGSNGVSEND